MPRFVRTEADVNVLMDAFAQDLKKRNLWQYYVLNTAEERANVRKVIASPPVWTGPSVSGKSVVELAALVRSLGHLNDSEKFHKRYAVRVDPGIAASMVKAAFTDLSDFDALADAWIKIVDVLNVALYQEWEDDTTAALDGIRGRLKFTRLDPHGPKLGEITKK